LACAHEFTALCEDTKALGYLCYLGHHGQQLRGKGKLSLVLDVALIALLPEDQAGGERYALVQLEGAWETLQKDRVDLPADWRKAN